MRIKGNLALWRSLAFVLIALSGGEYLTEGAQSPGSREVTSYDVVPAFKLRAERNLVIVRVVVRDGTGTTVDNLQQQDFQLFDRSKKQTILSFTLERPALNTSERLASKSGKETTATGPGAAGESALSSTAPGRFVGLFFDDANMEIGELTRARDAAAHFLSTSLQPADRIGVFTSTGQNQLDFTADLAKVQQALAGIHPHPIFRSDTCGAISPYEAYLIVDHEDPVATSVALGEEKACHLKGENAQLQPIVREPQNAAGMNPWLEYVKTKAAQAESESEEASLAALRGIDSLVRRMVSLPGQRSVVIVSGGFLTDALLYHLDEIADRALRSNVILNGLDARGLYTDRAYSVRSTDSGLGSQLMAEKTRMEMEGSRRQTDGMHDLAISTGGAFFENSNDLEAGFRKVTGAPESYYVLTFSPQNLKLDGGFHPLKVSLASPRGLSVQARKGYFAPRPSPDPTIREKAEIQEALFSQDEIRDLPVDVHTEFFMRTRTDAEIDVLTHLDLHQLQFRKEAGRNLDNLTLVVALFDQDGHYVAGLQKAIELRMFDPTLEKYLRSGVALQSEFDVKPGTYLVRTIVRESVSGQISALNRTIAIPY